MRISDWSSDVCSSDLAIVGDRALGAEHLRAQILKPFLEENLRALRRLGLGARLPRDIIVDPRIGDLRRLRRRMALVRDADRIGEPVALHRQPAEQGAARALAPARSEEHTSELPHLIRHSYAGFCWKNITTYISITNII